jgi:hypothetical protein
LANLVNTITASLLMPFLAQVGAASAQAPKHNANELLTQTSSSQASSNVALLSPLAGITDVNQQQLTPLTPHSAQYRVFYGSIELGLAKYSLPAHKTGLYRYEFDSEVSLLMLSDTRHIKSEFMVNKQGLSPYRYTHERGGTGSDYSEHTSFFKNQNNIFTIYKNEKADLAYEGPIFDPLMVQLQFRLDLSQANKIDGYKMVKEKEIDEYKFKVVGKETLTLDSGTYETIKIEVVRDSKKRQTFFWMAPDLAYLPVRLSHFSKGSKQLDIQLDSYEFELPKQVLIEHSKGEIIMGNKQEALPVDN